MNPRTEPVGQPLPSPRYDYTRFGRHRLRTPNGAVIDLPVPTALAARVWVATIWPEPHASDSWARQLWVPEPTGRGWVLPLELAGCDVVEFGADTLHQPVRWYGILNSYEVDRWTTVQGPYRHPGDAWTDAQRQLATVRFEPSDLPATNRGSSRVRPDRCHRHRPERRPRGSRPV